MDFVETDLRLPIGEAQTTKNPSKEKLEEWIYNIQEFPTLLENLTKNLSTQELNWRYRPNGWKVKQVVHHCADSHMNGYIRFKLALTEKEPHIKPYFEDRWAELPDSLEDELLDTLELITILHKKWVLLLKSLNEKELQRTFFHPESKESYNLAEYIGIYAWHGRHHLAHIKLALASKGIYQ